MDVAAFCAVIAEERRASRTFRNGTSSTWEADRSIQPFDSPECCEGSTNRGALVM